MQPIIILLQYVEDKEYPCGEIKEEKGIQVRINSGGSTVRRWEMKNNGCLLLAGDEK